MYRHCIKYFCLRSLKACSQIFNRQVDWPAFQTNIVFYVSVILTLSVSFRETLLIALAQILSVSVRCASWPQKWNFPSHASDIFLFLDTLKEIWNRIIYQRWNGDIDACSAEIVQVNWNFTMQLPFCSSIMLTEKITILWNFFFFHFSLSWLWWIS